MLHRLDGGDAGRGDGAVEDIALLGEGVLEAHQLLVQPLGELGEDFPRLARRHVVGAVHRVEEGVELLLQADREEHRALRLHVDQFALDGGDLVLQLLRRRADCHGFVVLALVESLLPPRYLAADGADAADGALRLRQSVANLEEQIALLGQLLLGRGDARVGEDFDGLRERPVANRQFRRVRAGQDHRPGGALPDIEVGRIEVRHAGVAHIPDEAINTRQRRGALVLVAVLRRTRVQADNVTRRVLDGDGHITLGALRQVILDDDALRRVCPGVDIFLARRAIRSPRRRVGDDARRCVAVVDHAVDGVAAEPLMDAHPHGRARREEMRRVAIHSRRDLPEGRHIVEDPEGAPVGGDDHLRVLDDEVVDRHDGYVATEPLPVAAVIVGDVDARLRAAVQQAALRRVLADDAREVARRDAVGDRRPRLAGSRSSCTGRARCRRSCSVSRRRRRSPDRAARAR